MNPKLFTLCSACSLLLCVAVCGLWVRSYFVSDGIYNTEAEFGDDREYVVSRYARTNTGGVRAGVMREDGLTASWLGHEPFGWKWTSRPATRSADEDAAAVRPSILLRRLGFDRVGWRTTDPKGFTHTIVRLPLWPVALGLAVLPALCARSLLRRARRVRVGRCADCGYDLRATPGRCPECGAGSRPRCGESSSGTHV